MTTNLHDLWRERQEVGAVLDDELLADDDPAWQRFPDLDEAIRSGGLAIQKRLQGHWKVWARLRFAGIRTSKRRVLRRMREHHLLAPSRVGRPHGSKAHDRTIRTERVDDM